ncbi:ABC transporter substrate-binding protein [Kineococcus sp. SYSU DK003]|uniref:ABC transporter substrate-binding protein n=1 Tax=Kineococcus sp. SYSU DK003 TaxID=3383124 RepID=UPI003D7D9DF7
MRRRSLLLLTSATAVVALAGCGSAEANASGTLQEGVIRVGTTSDTKPYAYAENGEYTGFDVEILEEAASRMDLTPEFVAQDFSAILPAVANGQVDVGVASISATAERKKTVDFTDVYFIGYLGIVTTADTGITQDGASLAGKRLGLVQGTIQDDYAQENFPDAEIVRFPDNNSAISALTAGTVDAHFLDLPPAQDYVTGSDGALHVAMEIPVPDFPVAMAVKKENSALLDGLNEQIAAMIADGSWLEIEKRYFPDQPVPDQFQPTS